MKWRKHSTQQGQRWESGDYIIWTVNGGQSFHLESPRFRYGWHYFTDLDKAKRYARIHQRNVQEKERKANVGKLDTAPCGVEGEHA